MKVSDKSVDLLQKCSVSTNANDGEPLTPLIPPDGNDKEDDDEDAGTPVEGLQAGENSRSDDEENTPVQRLPGGGSNLEDGELEEYDDKFFKKTFGDNFSLNEKADKM